jgi:hypothetical protein
MPIAMQDLTDILAQTPPNDLSAAIVNGPFLFKSDMVGMGIGIIVLLVCCKKDNQIHRVALSDTELGEATRRISLKKFEDIKIPAGYPDNIIARTIMDGEPQMTPDWKYLFVPALSPEQARLNQAAGGIACSYVYPVTARSGKGALIFSYYKEPDQISTDEHDFMQSYSQAVADVLDDAGIRMDSLLRR